MLPFFILLLFFFISASFSRTFLSLLFRSECDSTRLFDLRSISDPIQQQQHIKNYSLTNKSPNQRRRHHHACMHAWTLITIYQSQSHNQKPKKGIRVAWTVHGYGFGFIQSSYYHDATITEIPNILDGTVVVVVVVVVRWWWWKEWRELLEQESRWLLWTCCSKLVSDTVNVWNPKKEMKVYCMGSSAQEAERGQGNENPYRPTFIIIMIDKSTWQSMGSISPSPLIGKEIRKFVCCVREETCNDYYNYIEWRISTRMVLELTFPSPNLTRFIRSVCRSNECMSSSLTRHLLVERPRLLW